MLDFVIRNGRLGDAAGDRLVDIGFSKDRIAAVESNIVAEAPSYDAEGCLCCGGLIETHIHLDKSRIVERCAPEPSRSSPDHMQRVQAVKPTFTVADIYTCAKETLENCIKQRSRGQGTNPGVYSSSIATARIGLPVPPLILSGNPMNLNRPLPINFSRFIRPST